ncbi:glycerate kinase [Vibrio hippocampi]|uniref:Glycerate 2-kinase n=1 Tax=Vibrio hippocampi TaxID=654686 RepID=A0ABM8ZJA6_9VIBR|nr:glycerate kinase [Vibrio hippocampi]CAH0526917.1 Glycerate 2-kinase [Vibrio hippocampi]
MKIVIAPDSYKESLTAMEVAQAIENGFANIFPDAEYVKIPMADGGEGTVQSLVDATSGKIIEVPVTGPLGQNVEGFLGLVGDGSTAIIEMAAASGLHLVPFDQRNPLVTTTFGTGELIKAALDLNVKHIIIGIGGSATNDGGLGMAQALGIKLLDSQGQSLGFGGGALSQLHTIDLSEMDTRLADVKLEVACDVDNPLCGPKGAAAVFGPQKGATPEMVATLDANLAHYASVIKATTGKDVVDAKGAGAAGGLGAALLGLLGAELRPGIQIVIDAAQLATHVQDADLVITGEGRIDSQTIFGKTPCGVAKTAKQFAVPVIAIAGSVAKDYSVVHEYGIDAAYSVVLGATDLPTALKEAKQNVEITSRNVAATLAISSLNR